MPGLTAFYKEVLADMETPVSAYRKLCAHEPESYLFESGENLEGFGRYSIVAWDPLERLKLWHGDLNKIIAGDAPGLFGRARVLLEGLSCADLPPLPFVGSLVGYVGYDTVRLMEPLGQVPEQGLPVVSLCFPTCFAIFDHVRRMLSLVALAGDKAEGRAKLADMERRLAQSIPATRGGRALEVTPPPKERYTGAVQKAKEYILDGDIFQVVLSDQFTGRTDLDPLDVYRWLRVQSPSPYMFHMNTGDCTLVGASPETLVKVADDRVYIRPIAGTRGRSHDVDRDKALEAELMASDKERAEHLMLVDLARNDVGRVAEYGSVAVDPYMIVERFSHVMHITRQVGGRLRQGLDAFDAFRAGFPAGTVSGAPKVRAMEIIDELEAGPRGPYAGAVGTFGPGARTDTCIGIRQMVFHDDQFTMQVGAGIVADSIPEMEYQEIEHKAAQGLAALKRAAEGVS